TARGSSRDSGPPRLPRGAAPAPIPTSSSSPPSACAAVPLRGVIPWIIFAVVVVPLVVVAFVVSRRKTAAGEHAGIEDAADRERTEQEFAAAEAYQEAWHEADKEGYHEERLP